MSGPLSGVRVLDVSTVLAGPLACQILGDFGAEVIKIEHPSKGDSIRGHGPSKDGVPLWWTSIGRNKRCVGLYLGDPEGAAIFRSLAKTADVIVENFRPGTLEKWGIGPEVLQADNPRLVLVRVTGFGQSGPYAHRPGFGTLAESMSGFAAITGEPDGPPTLPPFGLADSIAGISAACSALMALYHRDARGGSGQTIDLAILEPIVAALGPQPMIWDQLGLLQRRTGNRSDNNAPRNTYRTKDKRWVAISTSATSIAERVMRLVGRPDIAEKPWFSSAGERSRRSEVLDGAVQKWIAARDLDEVVTAFEDAGAALAPIYDVEQLVNDPHVQARESIMTVADEDLGELKMQNLMFRLGDTPGAIRFPGRKLGQDTAEVYAQLLGLHADDVAKLREAGVV